jgi:hypothetical protein
MQVSAVVAASFEEYFPALQAVHAVPLLLEYLPFVQPIQARPPSADEYLPIPHRRHALTPVALEYVRAPQSKHADAPSVSRYLPIVQSRQTLTPSVDEYLPIPHRRHALTPVALEYRPTPQSKHADALDAAYLPTPQSRHADAPDAAYLPAPQSTHVLPPCIDEYLPIPHRRHALTPVALLGATALAVLFGFLRVVCVVRRTADARCFQGRRSARVSSLAECTGGPEAFRRVLRQTALHVQWPEPVRTHHVCGVHRFAAGRFWQFCARGRRRRRARVTARHFNTFRI